MHYNFMVAGFPLVQWSAKTRVLMGPNALLDARQTGRVMALWRWNRVGHGPLAVGAEPVRALSGECLGLA